jgi:hypothetical protein
MKRQHRNPDVVKRVLVLAGQKAIVTVWTAQVCDSLPKRRLVASGGR